MLANAAHMGLSGLFTMALKFLLKSTVVTSYKNHSRSMSTEEQLACRGMWQEPGATNSSGCGHCRPIGFANACLGSTCKPPLITRSRIHPGRMS